MYITLLTTIAILNIYLQRSNNGSQPVYSLVEAKYLPLLRTVLLADLLQLSFLIKQFEKSNFYAQPDVSVLIVTGLVFAAIASPTTSLLLKKYGVKRVAFRSCLTYAIASLMCLVKDIYVSWFARAISGISSAILMASLDVIAHAANDLEDGSELSLAEMLAKCDKFDAFWIVGLGILANVIQNWWGKAYPVLLSGFILLTVAYRMKTEWEPEKETNLLEESPDLYSIKSLLFKLATEPVLWSLSIVHVSFESCFIVLLLRWMTLMELVFDADSFPLYGVMFAVFVLSATAGSQVFQHYSTRSNNVYFLFAATTMSFLQMFLFSTVCLYCIDIHEMVFVFLVILSFCMGIYYPSITCLRKVIFGDSRAYGRYLDCIRVPVYLAVVAMFHHITHDVVIQRVASVSFVSALASAALVYQTEGIDSLPILKI